MMTALTSRNALNDIRTCREEGTHKLISSPSGRYHLLVLLVKPL